MIVAVETDAGITAVDHRNRATGVIEAVVDFPDTSGVELFADEVMPEFA